MAIEQAERAASDGFDDALTRVANGDAKPMIACWPHSDDE
jgi:hypothetical protein